MNPGIGKTENRELTSGAKRPAPLIGQWAYDFRMAQEPIRTFQRRILVVDKDEKVLKACSAALQGELYEVLTAGDGFDALQVLRGAVPDLMIVELNLPRMSGFELLAIVRARFPEVGVIATSADYSSFTVPPRLIADLFVEKGPNAEFELIEAALNLVRDGPVRRSRGKKDTAPVWIPRSTNQYVVLTCPECLRSFPAPQSSGNSGGPFEEACLSCGANVRFWLGDTEAAGPGERRSSAARSRDRVKRSKASISGSQAAIESSESLIDKHNGKE
jgi:CheY-like chemotaxis protein